MSGPGPARAAAPPLGGACGDWGRRVARHHAPLAIASAAIVFLWISLPLFRSSGHQVPSHAATAAQGAGHQAPSGGASHGRSGGAPPASSHAAPSAAAVSGQIGQMNHAPAPGTRESGEHTGPADGQQNRQLMARVTTATGYVALGLLALTLVIGPLNLAIGRRNPVSSYLRRDVGTWTAILSVAHVVAGFQVHGPPVAAAQRMLRYFFAPDGSPLLDDFGLGNWTGLAATVIVVGLLVVSSDAALRTLKAGPWKWLQRLNYALFALVVAHAIFYGALLRVPSPTTILLALTVAAVFAGQSVGIALRRRRRGAVPAPRLDAMAGSPG